MRARIDCLYEWRPAEFIIIGKTVVVLMLDTVDDDDAVRRGGMSEFGFWWHAPSDVAGSGNGIAVSAFERNIACAPCGFRLNTIPA